MYCVNCVHYYTQRKMLFDTEVVVFMCDIEEKYYGYNDKYDDEHCPKCMCHDLRGEECPDYYEVE